MATLRKSLAGQNGLVALASGGARGIANRQVDETRRGRGQSCAIHAVWPHASAGLPEALRHPAHCGLYLVEDVRAHLLQVL